MARVSQPWFERFFGRDYLILYAHTGTAGEVDAIEKILRPRKGARVLDVACGAGRHSIELAKRGYAVTGVDLSEALLREARAASKRARVRPAFVRRDMRDLRYHEDFDAALSMFTSFGYFDSPREDEKVIEGISRALKPRGKFLLEMFNRDSFATNLPQQGWRARDDGTVVLEEDAFDLLRGRFETRQIIIDRRGTREYTGSVRAYNLAELKEILERHGLFLHRALGGLDLSPYTMRSQRLVLYAVKGQRPETVRTMW